MCFVKGGSLLTVTGLPVWPRQNSRSWIASKVSAEAAFADTCRAPISCLGIAELLVAKTIFKQYEYPDYLLRRETKSIACGKHDPRTAPTHIADSRCFTDPAAYQSTSKARDIDYRITEDVSTMEICKSIYLAYPKSLMAMLT